MRTAEERAVRLWRYVDELLDLRQEIKALKLARKLVFYEGKHINNRRGTIAGNATFNRWRDQVRPTSRMILVRLMPIVDEYNRTHPDWKSGTSRLKEAPGQSR